MTNNELTRYHSDPCRITSLIPLGYRCIKNVVDNAVFRESRLSPSTIFILIAPYRTIYVLRMCRVAFTRYFRFMIYIEKSAKFSDDCKYRYLLSRKWDSSGSPFAMCIGLNPSRADNDKDDATIIILSKALRSLGYSGFFMCNLYALISPDPKDLSACPDPIRDNDRWLDFAAVHSRDVIFCWGNFKQAVYRASKMKQRFPEAYCFGKNQNGSPWHPRALTYAGIKPEEAVISTYNPVHQPA